MAEPMWGRCAGLLAAGVCVLGCSGDGEPAQEGASAGGQPAVVEQMQPREPRSEFDMGVPDSGLYCSTIVAAECDGNEDCPGDQLCCGTFNGGAFIYDEVKCQDTCEPADGRYLICHAGQECPVEGDVCRRSSVLPEYLAICTTPSTLVPDEFVGESTAAGEINCGRETVCGAEEQCCVMASWDASTQATVASPGVCAPMGTACNCDDLEQRSYEEP